MSEHEFAVVCNQQPRNQKRLSDGQQSNRAFGVSEWTGSVPAMSANTLFPLSDVAGRVRRHLLSLSADLSEGAVQQSHTTNLGEIRKYSDSCFISSSANAHQDVTRKFRR